MNEFLNVLLIGLACAAVIFVVTIVIITSWNYFRSTRLEGKVNAAMEAGDYATGYELAKTLAVKYPDGIQEQHLAARVALTAGHYQEAVQYANRAISLLNQRDLVNRLLRTPCKDPNFEGMTVHDVLLMEAENNITQAHILESYHQCNYEAALQEIDQLSQRIPFNRQIADSWRAHFCILLGRFIEANNHLDKAVLQDSEKSQYFAIRGHWHLVHGEEKAAIECYQRHNDWKSMEDDFKHIEMVFGIKPPRWN